MPESLDTYAFQEYPVKSTTSEFKGKLFRKANFLKIGIKVKATIQV